ncbi:hypothetical protein A6B34_00240 [Mycolicibacterium monacense]|nr:hypothetical protein A6B34_00240 [Mycolicibacterium monacense]
MHVVVDELTRGVEGIGIVRIVEKALADRYGCPRSEKVVEHRVPLSARTCLDNYELTEFVCTEQVVRR